MRNVFVNTIYQMAKTNDDICLITPDLGFGVLENFQNEFPDRFFNAGISEANAIGMASGLALNGKNVYVYSIIPFVTMRPFEQVRVDVAYMNTNVKIIGVGAGFAYGPAGATHHSTEDIAIMKSLPNMKVFSPCDSFEAEKIAQYSSKTNGPMYIRLSKNDNYLPDYNNDDFRLNKANIIRSNLSSKIVIFFTGNFELPLCVYNSIISEDIDVDLIAVHSIKPFDYDLLDECLKNKKYIYCIEEHSIIGGLGSFLAEYIAESSFNPVFKRYGFPDIFSHYVGDENFIKSKINFTCEYITKDILQRYIDE